MTTPINEPLYKKVEIVGTSDVSIESAVNNAVALSSQSLRNIRWFEVDEIRGSVENGQVNQWQVGLKLAFTVDHQDSTGSSLKLSQEADASQRPLPQSDDPNPKGVV